MGNSIDCCFNDTAEDTSDECGNGLISSESGFQLLNQNRFSQEYTMRDDLTSLPSKQSSGNHGSQSSFPYSSSEHLYINDHDQRYEEEEETTNSFSSWNSIPLTLFEVPTTTITTSPMHDDNIYASNNTTTCTTSPTAINPRSWQRLNLAPRYGDGMPVFVTVVKEGISIPETLTMLSTSSRVCTSDTVADDDVFPLHFSRN